MALDVQNNRLRSLPPQLGGMTTLRSFVIEGNPLKGFKPTVLQGPAKDVLAALRHRMAEVHPPPLHRHTPSLRRHPLSRFVRLRTAETVDPIVQHFLCMFPRKRLQA